MNIAKHVTGNGVIEGLKADVQRRIKTPKKLFDFLDNNKKGMNTPLIISERGERLSLCYSGTGIVKRLLAEHGVGTFHNLRHFAALQLFEKGVDVNFVSRLLGHKSIQITMDIYGRFYRDILRYDF